MENLGNSDLHKQMGSVCLSLSSGKKVFSLDTFVPISIFFYLVKVLYEYFDKSIFFIKIGMSPLY